MLYSTTLVALASMAAVVGAVPNFESKFLTQTNSLGVVTGQPAKVTSQPMLVTSQPPAPASTMGTSLLTAPGPMSLPPNATTLTSPTIVPPPITPSNNISTHPQPTHSGGSGGSTPPPNNGGSQLQAAGVSFLGLGALAIAML